MATQMEMDEIKDFITQAIQAGKSETSGLVAHIIEKLEDGIEKSINKNVNGKLDKMKIQLSAQDVVLQEIKLEQKRVSEELKRVQSDTAPIVDGQKVLTLLGKFVMWLGAIIITVLTIFKLVK